MPFWPKLVWICLLFPPLSISVPGLVLLLATIKAPEKEEATHYSWQQLSQDDSLRSGLGDCPPEKLYLSAWYWRLKQRTGAKRAIVALARKLLVIIYTMLKTSQPYDEQKFLERKQASEQKRVNRMVNELARLGYSVSLPS